VTPDLTGEKAVDEQVVYSVRTSSTKDTKAQAFPSLRYKVISREDFVSQDELEKEF
jgi:hypothetical protein